MDDFNKEFEKAFRDMEQHMGRMLRNMTLPSMASLRSETGWRPAVDIYVTKDAVLIFIETAGIDLNSLSVIASRNGVTIAGERRLPVRNDIQSIHRLEIEQGAFRRTVSLPVPVEISGCTSNCHNGILEIVMPRSSSGTAPELS